LSALSGWRFYNNEWSFYSVLGLNMAYLDDWQPHKFEPCSDVMSALPGARVFVLAGPKALGVNRLCVVSICGGQSKWTKT
jgi:hypothetical protein